MWVILSLIYHLPKLALAAALLAGTATSAQAQVTAGPPQFIGRWSTPFEEGGTETPLCSTTADGELTCKPVAQASAVLPDGRVFYFNGLENQEATAGRPTNASRNLRNSTSRILDLRSGVPQWVTPTTPDGGAGNPDITARTTPAQQVEGLAGTAGIPGGKGDGLVGSAWGAAGGPDLPSTAPPDDPEANDGDMFCADITSLPDGKLLIAGGADWYNEPAAPDGLGLPAGVPEAQGLRSTRIFDPVSNTFSAGGNMHHNRWYPGLVTLGDGRVLAAGGLTKQLKNTQLTGVRATEKFDPATNRWTDDGTPIDAEPSLPLSPRLHLLPNGRVLYAGAGESWGPGGATADEALYGQLQLYDPKTGRWERLNQHILGMRDGAASVLMPIDPPYNRADILTLGGALGPPPGGTAGVPLSTLTRYEGNGKITEEVTRFNMLEGRWFPSAVTLPDGSLLAAGGATSNDATASGTGLPVRTVELFDIRTETWYPMARISRDRTYHHSAVLLPDGRVLLGGHAPPKSALGPDGDLGEPFPNNNRDPSFEIFSPHYLFRGPRPIIQSAPAGVAWGETFEVTTRQALTTDSIVLMRLPSAQHSIDSDQRTVRLAFTRASGRLRVDVPPNRNALPPGYYYLFLNQQSRRGPVPSMARIVKVAATHDSAEAIQPFPDDRVPEGEAHDDVDESPTAPITEKIEDTIGEGASPSSRTVVDITPAEDELTARLTAAERSSEDRPNPGTLPVAAVLVAVGSAGWLIRRRAAYRN